MRVTAEVIDPHTQTTVWSESADGMRRRIGAAVARQGQPEAARASRRSAGDRVERIAAARQGRDEEPRRAARLFARRARLQHRSHRRDAAVPPGAEARSAIRARAPVDRRASTTNESQDDAAIKELEAALALREHLPARDAMYVEALRATFGPPRPALDQWKLRRQPLSRFLRGAGHLRLFRVGARQRYEQAIESDAPRRFAEESAQRQTSLYVLGTLYLGTERYEDALRHVR